jgi:hypothetical protein
MELPKTTCLLAFCRKPLQLDEAFRAELRGLGAPLFVFAP